MLLSLGVVCFLLGFFVAVVVSNKPKEARESLEEFSKKFSFILGHRKRGSLSLESVGIGGTERILQDEQVQLLTKAQCEELAPTTWQREAYEELKSILLARNPGSKKFPCIYATAGYKHDEHRYIFMHSENPTEPRNVRLLANAMRSYLPLSHSLGANTSLVIIHPRSESPLSVHDYQQKFWDLLRGLRTRDLRPWPSDIPAETTASKWAFCFEGVPWFPAAMTPAHRQRNSRFAPNFVVAMQPKWVFDNLFATPEKRRAAVQAVRRLMPAYDEIERSPDLSAYGTDGTTEAHQYFLLDQNTTAQCPFDDMDR